MKLEIEIPSVLDDHEDEQHNIMLRLHNALEDCGYFSRGFSQDYFMTNIRLTDSTSREASND